MYKIVRWFSAGGKTCYTGKDDTFKLYPEIGVLTAERIRKIDLLFVGEPLLAKQHVDNVIRQLSTKIDLFIGLYNSDVNVETVAYKKLHKFQLFNNISKALCDMNVRRPDDLHVQELTIRAIQEIEELIAIK
jgi:hypothetical protein